MEEDPFVKTKNKNKKYNKTLGIKMSITSFNFWSIKETTKSYQIQIMPNF